MKRWLSAIVIALVMAVAGLQAAPAWASDLSTVKIDVGAANGDYDGYSIDDERITVADSNAVYELSGSTEKTFFVDYPGPQETAIFRVRLNNVTLGGGIEALDNNEFRLKAEVPDGTVNYVDHLNPLVLVLSGGGTLNAESLDIGSAATDDTQVVWSCIDIEDTQVNVTRSADATSFCRWMGDATLSGDADVTIVSTGDHAALRVYSSAKNTTALTIKDNARLRCLHANPDEPCTDFVDGLQVERGKLTVEGNGCLEAEGRPLDDSQDEGGCGIFCSGILEVKDNAHVVTNAQGWSVGTMGDIIISGSGALVEANGTGEYGIYTEGSLSVSNGARVEANALRSAIFSEASIAVDGASVVAKSELDEPIVATDSISIKNSYIDAGSGQGGRVFSLGEGGDDSKITVDGSWLRYPADNEVNGVVTNSVLFAGDHGTVVGDAKTPCDIGIEPGETLTIPEGASLTVSAGTRFTNNGDIDVKGTFDGGDGTIVCNSHAGGAATCVKKGVCDVCGAEYLDSSNHAHGLKHVDAKAATAAAEGNIEYWFCPDCGKCFSDEGGTAEISKASTVVAKLAGGDKPAEQKTTVKTTVATGSSKKLAATGDACYAFAAAAAVLGVIVLAGAVVAIKQR